MDDFTFFFNIFCWFEVCCNAGLDFVDGKLLDWKPGPPLYIWFINFFCLLEIDL